MGLTYSGPCQTSIIELFSAKTFIPLSTNITKWSNTLKQFGGAFDHFVGLGLKVLKVQRILKRSQGSHVL